LVLGKGFQQEIDTVSLATTRLEASRPLGGEECGAWMVRTVEMVERGHI
jgi:hypothetical protein